jgi:hypothetical protein
MEFHDTVSDATLITEAIAAAIESSKNDDGKGKSDEGGIQEKVKDMAIEYIIGGTLGGLATVAGGACMYFRSKICGQTDENQQPNATAETPIQASTRPNLNPLHATIGSSNTNDEEELGLAKRSSGATPTSLKDDPPSPPLRARAMI